MYFVVNLTGSSIPVYNLGGGTQIGTLNIKETCLLYGGGEDGSTVIEFLNSSGNLVWGYIYQDVSLTKWTSVPYSSVGTDKVFKTRNSLDIYDYLGNYITTVAAGGLILTDSCLCGQTHHDWMYCLKYKNYQQGPWITISGSGQSYGFVNVDLEGNGSGKNYVALYGSWV